MRVVVQRSKNSKVTIDGKVQGQIGKGYVLLVGFTDGDNEKMNLSIQDIGGSILSISQFTLYANCKEGRRPSFTDALNPTDASKLYDVFNEKLSKLIHTETGIFGADMKVEIYNDGPVTIILDSKEIIKSI